jgi:tetratricopeptide (TPR) repeat protein
MRRGPAAAAAPLVRVRRWLSVVVLLAVVPGSAWAQDPALKAQFLEDLGNFSLALAGRHGDEGARLAASLDRMAASLARWDAALAGYEQAMNVEIAGADPARAARMRVALAGELLDRGLTARAVEQLHAARAADQAAPEPALLLGLAYEQLLDDPARAVEAFRAVSDADPTAPAHAYLLARALTAAGDAAGADEARRRLEGAPGEGAVALPFVRIGLLPETPGLRPFLPPVGYGRGFALLGSGALAEAIAAFREALRADPLTTHAPAEGSPRARAAAAFRDGRVAEARDLLRDALARDPDDAEASRVLGMVEAADGRLDEAVDLLGGAGPPNAMDERTRLALADVLVKAGRLDAAVASLLETIEQLPDSGGAHLALADVHQRQGSREGAIRELEATLALGPLLGVNTIHDTIGGLKRDLQDFPGAALAYEAAVALVPGDPGAHHALGKVYYDQARHTEALAEFRVAAMLAPSNAAAWTATAQVHLRERRYDDALATSLRALQLDVRDSEARYVYATALIRLGRADEGRREMEIYQRLQAEDAAARDRAVRLSALRREAEVATAAGEHARAAGLLREAFVIDPRTPRSHRDLGLALLASGRVAEAVRSLDTAVGLGAPIETYLELARGYDALGRDDDAARARAEHARLKQQAIREDGRR